MVDFLYHGEANVYQENLDTFLAMADELQLKGLKKREEEEAETSQQKVSNRQISQRSDTTNNSTSMNKPTPQRFENEAAMSEISETAIALNNFAGRTNLEDLDQRVKSLMNVSENRIGKQQKNARICKVCGKEGQMITIMRHIEANHMTDISLPCNACDKILHTRDALSHHNRAHHSQF